MRSGLLASLIAISITGCSAANAAQFDAENDIHCAALSVAWRIASVQQGAPADQQKAIAFVEDWYGRKVRELALSRGEEKVLAEANSIAKVVEKDLLSLKRETLACTDRAIKDAGLGS
jgi:predicted ATP-grasp superfamily ATP-dependent carboligase